AVEAKAKRAAVQAEADFYGAMDGAGKFVRGDAIAALHDVPIIESPELARTLFASASLGEPIPEQCYAAVASIFAMLLQTRGSLGGSDDR
ncbi:MAG TPA: FHIPEP family type III secretion protein, partial [Candidatus Eremiobacteraceae bacterium]|nr:FHIPEP family type III secretion protein [Candidatus Eremiobacteraceae bacterium]